MLRGVGTLFELLVLLPELEPLGVVAPPWLLELELLLGAVLGVVLLLGLELLDVLLYEPLPVVELY